MIQLQIQEYCNNCKELDPVCESIELTCFGEKPRFDTFVKCAHESSCMERMEYLKRELESEGNKC